MSLLSQETASDTKSRILDAAGRQVAAVGLSRTTLTDVATAAGLSRMTIYRNYSSVEEILQDLMTREFNGVVDQTIVTAGVEGTELTRANLIVGIVATLDGLATHPLFLRILAADPDLLLPYVTLRTGRFPRYAQDALRELLSAGVAAGEIRDDDPERLAASIMLALRGYALVDKTSWSKKHRAATLDDIALMLDGLLAPKGAR
jgi:AcrR family transcriptional regulator